MSNELLLRDHVEIERKRDEFARLDRINGNEKATAILTTRFDAALEWFEEELKRAVSENDLKELKREMEAYVNQSMAALFDNIKSMNNQQELNIMTQQAAAKDVMLAAIQQRRSKAVWWILGLIGAVITSVASTLAVVWITGRA